MLETKALSAFQSAGERTATAFLKAHPEIVAWRFCWTGGHSQFVLNEFPLGSRFRADFVVLLSYSGLWEVNFIELENTDDIIMTRAGKPSQRLNSAISQLGDWKDYVERNRVQVQSDLSSWCMEKDLLGKYSCETPPSNQSGNLLKDPDTHIKWNYHIVIGRRSTAGGEVRRKMNQFSHHSGIEIGTFDRFVDIAANYDRLGRDPDSSVNLREWRGDV